MADKNHTIQLQYVVFTRSVVIAIPNHQPSSDPAPLTIGPENLIDVKQTESEPGKYQVSMSSKYNINGDPAYPYIVDMECIGIFSADTTLEKEEALRGVTITGHSVLYGAIREAVAWITGRQPFGQLMLGLSVLRPAQQEAPSKN